MKRLIKLLLILPLLFMVSISAKEIDMNGEYFQINSLHRSGDVYSNVAFRDNQLATFDAPYGWFAYFGKNSNNNNPYNSFYNNNSYADVFNVVGNFNTQFIIPTYYGYNVIWKHYTYVPSSESSIISEKVSGSGLGSDAFKVLQTEPDIIIECDKSNLEYGEVSECVLYYKYSFFEGLLDNINYIDFDLSSDDYEIFNIKPTMVSDFNITGTHITGTPFSRKNIGEVDPNSAMDPETFEDLIEDDIACLHRDIPAGKSYNEIVGAGYDTMLYCTVPLATMKIKALTFDITPKVNDTKDGKISVSDFKMSVTENMDEVISNDNLEQIIPMTGNGETVPEVKGVEENPKTGLFNYILLIIPVILLGIGFNLLRKINIFKKL